MFFFSTYLLLWVTADAVVQHDAKEAIYKSSEGIRKSGLPEDTTKRKLRSPKEELDSHEMLFRLTGN